MKEFIEAALPFFILGLGLAVLFAAGVKRSGQRRRRKEAASKAGPSEQRDGKETPDGEPAGQQPDKETPEEEPGNYMAEGLSLGICFGAALGSAGFVDLSMGLSLGMLFGLLIGMNIKKQ